MRDPVAPLELYFDRDCPLCLREVAWLARRANPARLRLVSVQALDREFGPGREAMLRVLHARDGAGRWFRGVDANLAAWQMAGVGRRLAWLRWPLVYPLARAGYALFARYRSLIARLVGAKVCDDRCRATARRALQREIPAGTTDGDSDMTGGAVGGGKG